MEHVRGPAVRWLEGRIACPLAGAGARGANASNRLALDGARTSATIEGRRIVIHDREPCARLTLLGDFMLLGEGRTVSGRDVPFALHMRFDKKRASVRCRPHLHPSVPSRLASVDFEPFEIAIATGAGEHVVFDEALGREVATRPPLSAWVERALLSVRPEPLPAPNAVASLRVSVGIGPLQRAIIRADAFALGTLATRPSDLRALLRSGAWELRLTALSSLRVLREHLGRAMFLLGLDRVPAVASLARSGLAKGETLRFRLEDGRGSVSLGAREDAIPDAIEVARAFLELDFLGAILAQELASNDARDREAIVL